tara:strand:- start:90 stop:1046 length:957 start_codon:yes stop_codon:yes gene_type:complete
VEVIELKGVGKSYRGTPILENINLKINEGDIFGIIGQSGSGKTTLLNLIAGFLDPTDGEVLYVSKIDGKPTNLTKNLSKIKKHIGFNPQHTSFYPKLTVKENLMHFGQMYNIKKQTLMTNAKSLLEFTRLEKHQKKLADELSGGMQKRLDLACSLVHKPKLLLLDEPTSDLDFLIQEEICHLIKEVNKQNVTIVIASHHLDFLEQLCNKIAIVHEGKLKSYGNISSVQKPFLKEDIVINIKVKEDKAKIIRLIKKLPIKKIVDQGHQLVVYPIDPKKTMMAILDAAKTENLYLYDVDLRKPSLNEIFAKVTKGYKTEE